MTPTEVAAILRQLNAWRRCDKNIRLPDPRDIGEAIDAAIEMIERLKAALPARITPEQAPAGVRDYCHEAAEGNKGGNEMIDTKELRRLAQEAMHPVTKGRWMRLFGERTVYDRMEDGCRGIPVVSTPVIPPRPFEEACLDFIAAANPAAVIELLDRLEAAESEAIEQARLNGMGSEREAALMAKLEAAEKERDDLRAKIEAMEKQKPVAWGAFYFGGKRNGKLYSQCDTEAQIDMYIADRHQSDDSTFQKAPLYALPGAKGEAK